MASKMTTLRLTDEDLTLIAKLRRITGIEAMSTLIREALREYFLRHKPKPRKSAKK